MTKTLPLIALAPLAYLAAVVQTALGSAIEVRQVAPDLLALLAVVWLLLAGGPKAFLTAGAIGLASDLVAPGRIGLGAACYLLMGYALPRLRPRTGADWVAAQVVAVWIAVTVLSAVMAFAFRLLGETALPLTTLLVRSLGVGLYTAGVGLPVLMVLSWLREPLLARRRRLTDF